MINQYTTILFDIDDTLLDFQLAQHTAFKHLLETLDIPYKAQYYEQYSALNQSLWHAYEQGQISKAQVLSERFTLFFKQFNKTVDGHAIDKQYRKNLTLGHQLLPGTLESIKQLSNTHQLAIVSNGIYPTQMQRLKNNQLYPYFKGRIFISDAVEYQKPDTRFFDYVFNQLHITDRSTVLIVGDSLYADINGGQRSHIATCWINPKQLPTSDGICPTYTVSSVPDLFHLT